MSSQRASKAFVRIYHAFCFAYEHAEGDEALFFRLIRAQAPVKVASTKTNDRTLSIRPLVRPDPDVKRLAQAFLRLAERQADRERNDTPDADK